MGSYLVTAPFVLLKRRNPGERAAINGYYAGAIVTDDEIDDEYLQRHENRGWVEKMAEPEPEPDVEDEETAAPVDSPEPDDLPASMTRPVTFDDEADDVENVQPKRADSKDAWVDYAVSQGFDRDEADGMTKNQLVELLK